MSSLTEHAIPRRFCLLNSKQSTLGRNLFDFIGVIYFIGKKVSVKKAMATMAPVRLRSVKDL